MVTNTRCYKIGPGERLKRRELGRGRGLLVRSAARVVAAEGQRRKRRRRMKMRLRKGEIISLGRGAPSAKDLQMSSPPPQKLNGPLLDVADAASFGE